MHDVLESMRLDLETRGLTQNSIATYMRCAQRFVAEVGIPVRRVKRDDVRQYLATLRRHGVSSATRNVGHPVSLLHHAAPPQGDRRHPLRSHCAQGAHHSEPKRRGWAPTCARFSCCWATAPSAALSAIFT